MLCIIKWGPYKSALVAALAAIAARRVNTFFLNYKSYSYEIIIKYIHTYICRRTSQNIAAIGTFLYDAHKMIALVGVEKIVVFKQTNLCDIDKFAEKKPNFYGCIVWRKDIVHTFLRAIPLTTISNHFFQNQHQNFIDKVHLVFYIGE